MSLAVSTNAPERILAILGPSCRDNARRQLLLGQVAPNVLHGIDYVEYTEVAGVPTLQVHFLDTVPPGAWGLEADPAPVLIHGGTRITGITVTKIHAPVGNRLDMDVSQQGDFSAYLLTIGWGRDGQGNWVYLYPDIDRQFSVAAVNFRPGCPVDFDCAPGDDCGPDALREPALDYLARDYASFRQLLIDLVAQRNPGWTERSPADLGITLLELFATEGDHLAYLQDAVANEAYLDTARQRESAKRHARLVDYRMHDGHNASAWVHLAVDGPGSIPRQTQFVTRIDEPLRWDRDLTKTPFPQPLTPPGVEIHAPSDYTVTDPFDDYDTDPALRLVRVFELQQDLRVDPLLNELRFHTWGNENCCLPRGATTAHVYAIRKVGNTLTAVRPLIKAGDHLLFEEVRGPETGSPADADPAHRQVVKIKRVAPDPSTLSTGAIADQLRDRLFGITLKPDGTPLAPGGVLAPANSMPLVEITWEPADKLTFPLCLAAVLPDDSAVAAVSVARGNIGSADHGRTVIESRAWSPPFGGDRARVRLSRGPLTMTGDLPASGCQPKEATPAISVEIRQAPGPFEAWNVVPDLLSSQEYATDVVVDVDADGRPTLRFGDGQYGQMLSNADELRVTYRIGNGRPGNIGAEGLHHIVVPAPRPASWPSHVSVVRNPLPGRGGIDAETIEEVRQHAPAAFRAEQCRAVTEADYRQAALTAPGVSGAVASFRWTGSWYTAFVGVDPADPDLVHTDARGHVTLEPDFRQSVTAVLDNYRLAGYDVEVRAARYVPLDVAIEICLKHGFHRGDVVEAVVEVLTGLPGHARLRPPLFDPANFTFGDPVYLSRIYAAVEGVQGVDSADVRVFHPHGRLPARELEQGFVPIGPWEIARLDNDASHMENGSLTVTAGGDG